MRVSLLLLALLAAVSLPACGGTPKESDADGDGYVSLQDCDDADDAVHPDADELCNGVDDDCDGTADNDSTDRITVYTDADADGFGDPAAPIVSCEVPAGAVADDTDCDDTDATAFPENPEVCDEVDNDCDGRVDEGASDIGLYFEDTDGDGYGNADVPQTRCGGEDGWVLDHSDCDDTDVNSHPGATDTCGDGVDQDCQNGDAACPG
jgi:hypothetical protein